MLWIIIKWGHIEKKDVTWPLNSLHKEAEANLINHTNNLIITTGDRCLVFGGWILKIYFKMKFLCIYFFYFWVCKSCCSTSYCNKFLVSTATAKYSRINWIILFISQFIINNFTWKFQGLSIYGEKLFLLF